MNILQIMKSAMNAQRCFSRSGLAVLVIPRALLCNPINFIDKHYKTESLGCHTGSIDSFSASQIVPKSLPKSLHPFDSRHHDELGMNFRHHDDSDWKQRRLIPLFALALFSSKKDKEEEEEKQESELITMIKYGVLAIQRDELEKAERLLHVALKTAQEVQNNEAVTYIFDLLANLAYQKGEYEKAEKLFKDVLKRLLSDGMAEDDNAVVEISLKLASVYATRGDYEKSVQGFHFCLGTQETKIKKHGESNVDEDTLLLWAMSMDWYARFLLSLNEYEFAKKHFIKAYEMSERVNGPGHPQTAVLLNDIGSVCSLQKNYTEAVSYLEKAINAARECKSPDIGSFYVNLGAVYLQQGFILEAERCCKEGLALAKKMKNSEAEEEAKSCLHEISVAKAEVKKK